MTTFIWSLVVFEASSVDRNVKAYIFLGFNLLQLLLLEWFIQELFRPTAQQTAIDII